MTSMDSTPAAGGRTEAMRRGRHADSARRQQRVIAALTKDDMHRLLPYWLSWRGDRSAGDLLSSDA